MKISQLAISFAVAALASTSVAASGDEPLSQVNAKGLQEEINELQKKTNGVPGTIRGKRRKLFLEEFPGIVDEIIPELEDWINEAFENGQQKIITEGVGEGIEKRPLLEGPSYSRILVHSESPPNILGKTWPENLPVTVSDLLEASEESPTPEVARPDNTPATPEDSSDDFFWEFGKNQAQNQAQDQLTRAVTTTNRTDDDDSRSPGSSCSGITAGFAAFGTATIATVLLISACCTKGARHA